MIVDIISIVTEESGNLFHLSYKVNGHLRAMRVTRIELSNYVCVQLDIDSEISNRTFDNLVSNESTKHELFYSFLKHFHYI